MKIVIELDGIRLGVAEYVSETEKIIKISEIRNLAWVNRCFKRQINKKDCLYCGNLTPEIGSLVTQWNEALKNEKIEINIAMAKRQQTTELLKEELIQKRDEIKT